MKKALNIILTVFVVAILFVMTGCQSGGDNDTTNGNIINKNNLDKYKSRERTFTFCYYSGGYGSSWIEDVLIDYMENYNTSVYIEPVMSVSNENARQYIQSKVSGLYDLYLIGVDMFRSQDSIVCLDSLMDKTVPGESVTVKDKIGSEMYSLYQEDGSIYQLPANTTTGFNWVYNKDVLDKIYGEGNYTLPRTTDEFFALGEDLLNNGYYLSAFSGDNTNGGDYTTYAYETWFAQLLGKEAYEQFKNGYYYDEESGQYVFTSETEPTLISAYEDEIEKAYFIIEKLATKDNDYLHPSSTSLDYHKINRGFYGGKFVGDKAGYVFTYTGAWLEQEVTDDVNEGIITLGNARAMKTPVISSIINKLSTINDDETLANVVSYVDGDLDTKPEGVSDEDIETVREARNMHSVVYSESYVIPKSAKNQDDILDFLAYLTSDRAQMIASKKTGGVNILPYGYVPTDSDMGFEISGYIKSVNEISENSVNIDWGSVYSDFKTYMNLEWYHDDSGYGGTITASMFVGEAPKTSDIYQTTYKYFQTNWKSLFTTYNSYKNK